MRAALLCLALFVASVTAAVDIDTCYGDCFTIESLCPGLHTSCNATCAVNATFEHGCVGAMSDLVFSMNATNNTIVLDHSCAHFPSYCFTGFGPKLQSMLSLIGKALRPGGSISTVLEDDQTPLVSMDTTSGDVHFQVVNKEPTYFDRWNDFWDSLSS
jgi:hypothetical protein